MKIYDLAEKYRKSLKEEYCQNEGIYYTPPEISIFMVKNLLDLFKFNKELNFMDIASGCGIFYIEILEELLNRGYDFEKFSSNFFAVDKDKDSLEILKDYLKFNIKNIVKNNIFSEDILLSTKKYGKFDLIIGNPPYVGHKKIEKEYSKKLRKLFPEVFKSKSDLYYCFLKRHMTY